MEKYKFYKSKPLKRLKISGYVNNKFVVAYLYPNKDSGLNYFKFNNKSYFGNVIFTNIISKEKIDY